MQTLLLCWLPLCTACGLAAHAEPPEPPKEALEHVIVALDDAVRLCAAGEPGAEEAWDRALETFETAVEPALRQRASPTDVVAVEYAFARIHLALVQSGDPAPLVDDLGRELQRSLQVPAPVATR